MKILQILECTNLNEALETKFQQQSEWEFSNGEFTRTGTLDNETYRVYIQPLSVSTKSGTLSNSTFLNLGFAKKNPDGTEVEHLQNSKDNKIKVIGAVTNALKEKVSELTSQFDINFIVLFVVNGEEQRLGLYERLVKSPMYGLRPWRKIGTVVSDKGTFIVCTKNAGAPPNVNEFFEWLKDNDKTFRHEPK